MQTLRFPTLGLWVACLALVGLLAPLSPADAEESLDITADVPDHACPAPEVHKTFRPEGDALDALLEAATKYFDLEEDLYVGRLALLTALKNELSKGGEHEGYDLLKDMEFLKHVIYQTRYFMPQWSNKKYRAEFNVENYKSKRNWHHLRSDDISFAYSLPKDYPRKNKAFAKLPRDEPLPLLVSTIMKQDYTGQKFPGFSLLERRFYETPSKDILDEWAVMVPIAPAGKYVRAENGHKTLNDEYLTSQLMLFFESYNIDFDRIVMDGGPEARLIASQAPFMFAGLVFRTNEDFTEDELKLVKNYASVPIYVLRCPKTTKALQDAGHPDVTKGDENGLLAWLNERKRKLPTKFSWEIAGPAQQFAYWINLEQVNFAADQERKIDVEVVDTEEEPNTIKIDAMGVRELSLYLNDDIVNLSKPVRIVINGHLEKEEKFSRDLDVAFNQDPLKIRDSLYFGLLYPTRVMRLRVRPPKVEPKEEPTTVSVDPEVEKAARELFDKGLEYEKAGKIDGAKKRYDAVIKKYPDTAAAKESQVRLDELAKG